jgi:hypothetical protein
MKKGISNPAHPERVCWGCDRYCAADDLACGNGSIRTQHPAELLGTDWNDSRAERGRDREDERTVRIQDR